MSKREELDLHIVSGTGELFVGKALAVNLDTALGEITVLPNHAPLIATIVKGVVKVRTKDGEKEFPSESGVIDITPEKTVILLHTDVLGYDHAEQA